MLRRVVLGTMLLTMPVWGQASRKPKARPAKVKTPPAAAQIKDLKEQVAKLTQERDDLKGELASRAQDAVALASAQKSRDLARQEAEACQKELDDLKRSLQENQKGGDTLLKELAAVKKDLEACQVSERGLKEQLGEAQAKLQGEKLHEGMLVPLIPDIIPARALNLNRVTPKVRRVDRGVVVVNVLVSEKGDVLDVTLLQKLPEDNEWTQKAHEACLEAAKRLVFDPARTKDGKTRVKVWQGVGFLLD